MNTDLALNLVKTIVLAALAAVLAFNLAPTVGLGVLFALLTYSFGGSAVFLLFAVLTSSKEA
jgi:hypothetical protein